MQFLPNAEHISRVKIGSADHKQVYIRLCICLLTGIGAKEDRLFRFVFPQDRRNHGYHLFQRIHMSIHANTSNPNV